MSKGSKRRKAAISDEQMERNWEAAFGCKPRAAGISKSNMQRLEDLFNDPSVGRVLISGGDSSEWTVPNIEDILGKEKADIVRKDIQSQ